jgi:L,D-transpeptidase ErfK/SrfK
MTPAAGAPPTHGCSVRSTRLGGARLAASLLACGWFAGSHAASPCEDTAAASSSIPASIPASATAAIPPAATATATATATIPARAPHDAQDEMLAVAMTGGRSSYTVVRGDHLTGIGARFGISVALLARDNGLDRSAVLRVGQSLTIDNRHLAPAGVNDGILINIPQRMLFHFEAGRLRAAYPVALGKPTWPTPTGGFRIASLVKDKPWLVPKSIQEEMRREGKEVLTRVEPGPDNPLGRHWIGLSIPGLGIHGTIAPSSIYGLRSHGCIRLRPDDVAELFERVRVGTPGEIVYRTALLAALPDGRIFVEINPDAYRRAPPTVDALRRLADRHGLSNRIDWGKVRAAVSDQDGVAREIGVPIRGADRDSR